MGNPDAVEATQQNTQKEKETERFITSTHSDLTKKAKSVLLFTCACAVYCKSAGYSLQKEV